MDLGSEQYFIYAWRYRGETEACKLGVSTLRTFYARIKAARTVTYQEIELLGIEVFDTEAEARAVYKERLAVFERLADRRAWVVFDAAVQEWLDTVCVSDPPPLGVFKDAFQKDPVRRVSISGDIESGIQSPPTSLSRGGRRSSGRDFQDRNVR